MVGAVQRVLDELGSVVRHGGLVGLLGVLIGWMLHGAAHAEPEIPEVTLDTVMAAAPPRPDPSDAAIITALLPFYSIVGLSDSTTVALLERLEQVEGYRSHAYRDSGGTLTIGIGANIETGPGIPKAVAIHWALAVVAESCNTFARDWPDYRRVLEPLRAGLCDASYQLGPEGLEGFRNTLPAIAAGRCADAVKGIEGSAWARETRNRADRLAHLVQRYACQPGGGD